MDSKTIYNREGSSPVPRITLRPQEAADALGISVSTLERLTKAGEIPRFKEGNVVHYRVASLEAWAARREAIAAGRDA
jgi:excisionase family DNA binding protein